MESEPRRSGAFSKSSSHSDFEFWHHLDDKPGLQLFAERLATPISLAANRTFTQGDRLLSTQDVKKSQNILEEMGGDLTKNDYKKAVFERTLDSIRQANEIEKQNSTIVRKARAKKILTIKLERQKKKFDVKKAKMLDEMDDLRALLNKKDREIQRLGTILSDQTCLISEFRTHYRHGSSIEPARFTAGGNRQMTRSSTMIVPTAFRPKFGQNQKVNIQANAQYQQVVEQNQKLQAQVDGLIQISAIYEDTMNDAKAMQKATEELVENQRQRYNKETFKLKETFSQQIEELEKKLAEEKKKYTELQAETKRELNVREELKKRYEGIIDGLKSELRNAKRILASPRLIEKVNQRIADEPQHQPKQPSNLSFNNSLRSGSEINYLNMTHKIRNRSTPKYSRKYMGMNEKVGDTGSGRNSELPRVERSFERIRKAMSPLRSIRPLN